MESYWQGIALGILQGLTEFLPISSSGHLVLAQALFKNFTQPGILFDVALHLATAFAVVVYFYRDIVEGFCLSQKRGWLRKPRVDLKLRLKEEAEEKKMEGDKLKRINGGLVWLLILALIPTGIIGFLIKDFAQAQFENPRGVGFFLILTGVILFGADLVARKRALNLRERDPNGWQSLLIGMAQGLAVFPGLSRSGITISAGIFSGLRGDYSARFSFLLSVPAILGVSFVELMEQRQALMQFHSQDILFYFVGMFFAFVIGYLSIGVVFNMVKRIKLSWFGGYCVLLGVVANLIWLLNK